ncbi:MAG: roadblock/LC7 domain-containing protein [Candidatus Sericytochromatia bacterium]|nr:roadblock/LC7 domain-containing protein [Candidatus Sericytochromatia bacterium]
MAKPSGNLVLTEAGVHALNALTGKLQQEIQARAVLLIEKSGQIITAQGQTSTLDTLSLAALISGSFASTKALARLLGEKHFKTLFQQGKSESIFVVQLETTDTLAVIFGPQATIGLVKFKTMQALDNINAQILALYTNKKPTLSNLSQSIDNLF